MKQLKAQRDARKSEIGADADFAEPTSPSKLEKAASTIQQLGTKIAAEEAILREIEDEDFPMNENPLRRPQDDQDDWLADNIDFSDEEDLTHAKGYITNAPMYQQRN